ncbi:MAG: DTW domain-containing protein [Deltaproteobacteria bacterium]|nr:MAG: DTW domain-containing protein [Deltaproteobacteria bacterium]
MNLQEYLEKKKTQLPKYRTLCLNCRQPDFRCYCSEIQKFDPGIKFVILIHPIEVRRPIATGRLSYLCMEDAELIVGHQYSQHPRVNGIIHDSKYHSVVLYPGRSATNLTLLSSEERREFFPKNKKLVIFVIDGTWNTAKKTLHLSPNLQRLPQIFFTPPRASTFRVRTQPKPECYSSVEAIHHTIELVGDFSMPDLESQKHNILLSVFDHIVEKQLAYVKPKNTRHSKKSVPKTR